MRDRVVPANQWLDYAARPPVAQARASKESTLKGTQSKLEPGLAGLPY
jgi:hypothetical protein